MYTGEYLDVISCKESFVQLFDVSLYQKKAITDVRYPSVPCSSQHGIGRSIETVDASNDGQRMAVMLHCFPYVRCSRHKNAIQKSAAPVVLALSLVILTLEGVSNH